MKQLTLWQQVVMAEWYIDADRGQAVLAYRCDQRRTLTEFARIQVEAPKRVLDELQRGCVGVAIATMSPAELSSGHEL